MLFSARYRIQVDVDVNLLRVQALFADHGRAVAVEEHGSLAILNGHRERQLRLLVHIFLVYFDAEIERKLLDARQRLMADHCLLVLVGMDEYNGADWNFVRFVAANRSLDMSHFLLLIALYFKKKRSSFLKPIEKF